MAFATSHFLACTIDGKCSNGLPVCPMMALSGHHTRTYEWPLSGVKRTAMSAHDPKADMRKSQIRLEEAAQNGTVALAPAAVKTTVPTKCTPPGTPLGRTALQKGAPGEQT